MEAEAKGKELAEAMQKATNEDDLQNITYADVQALELNSLDTQEGMSGVYRNRWEIAKGLSAGEVYVLTKIMENLCYEMYRKRSRWSGRV